MSKHTPGPWVMFCNLTQTYTTPDGTRVGSELADNVGCLADVLHVASIRQQQRDQIKVERLAAIAKATGGEA